MDGTRDSQWKTRWNLRSSGFEPGNGGGPGTSPPTRPPWSDSLSFIFFLRHPWAVDIRAQGVIIIIQRFPVRRRHEFLQEIRIATVDRGWGSQDVPRHRELDGPLGVPPSFQSQRPTVARDLEVQVGERSRKTGDALAGDRRVRRLYLRRHAAHRTVLRLARMGRLKLRHIRPEDGGDVTPADFAVARRARGNYARAAAGLRDPRAAPPVSDSIAASRHAARPARGPGRGLHADVRCSATTKREAGAVGRAPAVSDSIAPASPRAAGPACGPCRGLRPA